MLKRLVCLCDRNLDQGQSRSADDERPIAIGRKGPSERVAVIMQLVGRLLLAFTLVVRTAAIAFSPASPSLPLSAARATSLSASTTRPLLPRQASAKGRQMIVA